MIALYPACWFARGCSIPFPSHPPAIFHPSPEQGAVGLWRFYQVSQATYTLDFFVCIYLLVSLLNLQKKKALLFGIKFLTITFHPVNDLFMGHVFVDSTATHR